MTELEKLALQAEELAATDFARIEKTERLWTARVLEAFAAERVSDSCFGGTTGYGYDDRGREILENVFARVFGAEAALVRTGFVNGTHAIGCGMLSCLSSGDTLLSVTGTVYDTLGTLVGKNGPVPGSFPTYGIGYMECEPEEAEEKAALPGVKAVFIQRTRGYTNREAMSIDAMGELIAKVKKVNPKAYVIVDNCYGEFCADKEPLAVGADLICGSLIKNPGGGIAPCGGYVAGKRELVENAACRLTVPGIGGECGATLGISRQLFQGFFNAPHATAQALKTACFASALFTLMGYHCSPAPGEERYDIIQSISFGEPEGLKAMCRGIQAGSPVDSFATPEPWDMPGYNCPVIMAAGTFVQGSSLELSCDAPMRDPFTAYMQGGLTYEAGRYGLMEAAKRVLECRK